MLRSKIKELFNTSRGSAGSRTRDNAPMERLFRSLKSEWIPPLGYMSKTEAVKDISYYLMDYYNWRRPHQFNNGVPPAKAENPSNLMSGIS